ncbi:MAG: acyl-ACP--UDP-N-acetylglucosamine O-acyltransferase [Acidobacteriota bacterium]|nr:acyl-ACP--UDP-N-acetylglucosamine O-acyltransferase [Acidobacteriota bacterium]
MPSHTVHPTALVASGAKLAEGVLIGPYAVVEDRVEIGEGTTIGPHAVIHSNTRVGKRNRIHAHVVLGDDPQHLSYKGEKTLLEIGDDNVFREMVTAHRSIDPTAPTRIGSNCYLMTNCHVGHDCVIDDAVIITSNVALGGHVEVGERAVIGGAAGVHQFVRIGAYSMVGAHTYLTKDALPFTMIAGEPARHYRLNAVGLKRNGIKGADYRVLEQAFRRIRTSENLDNLPVTKELVYLREWLAADSKRGLTGFVKKG